MTGEDRTGRTAGAENTIIQTENATLLSELHTACFDDGWSVDAFADMVTATNIVALVAADRTGRHVGCLVLHRAADEAEIITLGVLPDARRSGVASVLLAAGMTLVEKQGARSLFLEVADDNPGACAFYSSNRFEEIGRRKAYYTRPEGNNVDAIVMRAPLPERTER